MRSGSHLYWHNGTQAGSVSVPVCLLWSRCLTQVARPGVPLGYSSHQSNIELGENPTPGPSTTLGDNHGHRDSHWHVTVVTVTVGGNLKLEGFKFLLHTHRATGMPVGA